ncbi:TetR/AcrR family transcriptional regulator [Sphingosinicella rhizophila]|uniref:TetR/AcrR family transcriptional regulator n=1 Tax=Sphingosinicella rhizophila TaxID=3050082 RepID=A0ABU3QAE9_9SPHN|nr:TetR/AcrR family transcriptional regulator [Sphingosinicella sp. GR2756]MDT9599920.1 TetR/AcrR family transcriptional regulator [Sphingosinicella sp. GR2756]
MTDISADWTKDAVVPMELAMRDDPPESVRARRLTREDWLNAARKALVKSGIDDVKVDRLAKKLKASRGSFYWHFKSHADLLQALLQDWEVRNQVVIAQTRDRWEEEAPDLAQISRAVIRENPGWLDWEVNWATQSLAMRLWARKSKTVGKAVVRIDRLWQDLLRELFLRLGYSDKESLVRARILYFNYLGAYSYVVEESFAEMEELFPIYHQVLIGGEPSQGFNQVLKQVHDLLMSNAKPVRRRAAKES